MSVTQTDPKPSPDLFAQAGEILADFAAGKLKAGTPYLDRQETVVITSALLAIAAGLRDVQNNLHEINQKMEPDDEIAGLRSQLAQMDADNAALTSALFKKGSAL